MYDFDKSSYSTSLYLSPGTYTLKAISINSFTDYRNVVIRDCSGNMEYEQVDDTTIQFTVSDTYDNYIKIQFITYYRVSLTYIKILNNEDPDLAANYYIDSAYVYVNGESYSAGVNWSSDVPLIEEGTEVSISLYNKPTSNFAVIKHGEEYTGNEPTYKEYSTTMTHSIVIYVTFDDTYVADIWINYTSDDVEPLRDSGLRWVVIKPYEHALVLHGMSMSAYVTNYIFNNVYNDLSFPQPLVGYDFTYCLEDPQLIGGIWYDQDGEPLEFITLEKVNHFGLEGDKLVRFD